MLKRKSFDVEKYEDYVREYIRKSEEQNKHISSSKLRYFDLPDSRWFIKHCPDKNVKTYTDFVAWCGIIPHYGMKHNLSKAEAIRCIYKMQEDLDRPLQYDDFRGNGCHTISISYIRETWGSVNKMKKELGLKIVQESMLDKKLSKEKFDKMILSICEYVSNEGRDFITTAEIDKNKNWNDSICLRKYSNIYYGLSLPDVLEKHGIHLGKRGRGISYDFEDGEHVTSQFEYMFSKYLKDYGLKYNVDYFRDVKYSSFIPEYKNNMNCDYVMHIDNKIIYIEIAGILAEYKTWFYNDREITRSKSKEQYRQKLKKKEEMLRSNGLIYFILFPCDLTKSNFKNILEDGSLQLKKNIENFNQNNIDWVKIRENGELDYSKPFLRDTRPKKEAV